MKNFSLSLLPLRLAVSRLDSMSPIPFEALKAEFWSLTHTGSELSVVAEEEVIPHNWHSERGWRCLQVNGPLEFDMIGVVSSISSVLADAQIPIFVISTYDTDYILIHQKHLDKGVAALQEAGHVVLSN